MSFSTTIKERRLSDNGRNAYLSFMSAGDVGQNVNKRADDSLYLSTKPLNRTRSCSPLLMKNIEEESTKTRVNVADETASDNKKDINTISENNKINKTVVPANIAAEEMPIDKMKTQMGIDRYITVLKRGRSPNSSKVAPVPKINKNDKDNAPKSQNRFAALDDGSQEEIKTNKSPKPPPVYLREQTSTALIKLITTLIGENSFYVASVKRGTIFETKIQVNTEDNFRKLISEFEKVKKNFYTYQLKSGKGLQVVLKGIDPSVEPEEIKCSLQHNGFKIKSVVNIRNRERVPQPIFRVELEPNDIKLKKNEVHPIYNIKYLLHRRIVVEEPYKRSGPVQCQNCQEYGHTRSYCKLPPVCVICGELHSTAKCSRPKSDTSLRKCSNCGGNHTANYRGCPVYYMVKNSMAQRSIIPPTQTQRLETHNYTPIVNKGSNNISYASVLKSNSAPNSQPTNNQTPNAPNLSRLETTIEALAQSVNNFTNTLSNMMQEMLKMQSMLLQAVLNKP